MTIFRSSLILLMFISLWGCSKGSNNSVILDASGKHPAGWVNAHASFFRALPGAIDDPAVAKSSTCTECHGSDLKGGIAKVSCFSQGFAAMTCHFHPVGYRNGNSHGNIAKSAPTFSSGFDSCRGCHGSQYVGGTLSMVSCSSATSLTDPAFACHGVGAAHAKNWASSTTSNHSNSNPGNAAACYQCHASGKFLTHLPAPPPQPAGTPPNCFNNTLCHGGLHPSGWITPAQHGAVAKSQPGTAAGFNSCQTCHGTDFKGGSAGVSCFSASSPNGSCHLRNGAPVNAPHAALPWRAVSPNSTHTSSVDDAQGLNARVCAQCHLKGANLRTAIITSYSNGTPSCFNNTICHGVMGHPTGWAAPAQHGATAKANLTYCQTCHSNNPSGGPGSNPRFNVVLGRLTAGCETCHGLNTAHPPVLQIPAPFGITSPDPLGTLWFRHRTTTNFDACNRCHGAILEGGVGPRCQNCHVAASPQSTINSPDPCSSCHSQPPSGTVYPNINAAHSNHLIINVTTGSLCNECHLGFGSGTLTHFNKAKLQPTQQVADMAFGTLSKTGSLVPAYNSTNQQCTNTYCHGNAMPKGDITGSNRSPIWSAATYPPVLSASFCGKCHGFPPTTASGHPAVTIPAGFPATPLGTTCSCHANINTQTATAATYANVFVDRTKHINGTLEVTAGVAHAVPNYNHQAAGTGAVCTGCHAIGTASSFYPATVLGNAPDCRGCHKKAAPGIGCGSCHGDATGRPSINGVKFPDREGRHQGSGDGAHLSAACTKCHNLATSGTGSTVNHGPGNRDTNPNLVGPGFVTGITITFTGTSKGASPSATCNHSTIDANNGGGCSGGPSSATW